MEEKKDRLIAITNRNHGTTAYSIPGTSVNRVLTSGQTITVPLSELQQLQWAPGGEYTLRHLLMIGDKEALEVLNIDVEPEYFYTVKEIEELLINGSLEQLEDTLNFAPEGVIELLKDKAIELELPDVRKRNLISKKLQFNVTTAIEINKMAEDDSNTKTAEETGRKAKPIEVKGDAAKRKAPNYKVVG